FTSSTFVSSSFSEPASASTRSRVIGITAAQVEVGTLRMAGVMPFLITLTNGITKLPYGGYLKYISLDGLQSLFLLPFQPDSCSFAHGLNHGCVPRRTLAGRSTVRLEPRRNVTPRHSPIGRLGPPGRRGSMADLGRSGPLHRRFWQGHGSHVLSRPDKARNPKPRNQQYNSQPKEYENRAQELQQAGLRGHRIPEMGQGL